MVIALDVIEAPLVGALRGLFTTRSGGVSQHEFATLNLADHVGDDAGVVAENRQLVLDEVGGTRLVIPDQVHGAEIRTLTSDHQPGRCDGLVTTNPGIPLAVVVADCLPILLADPIVGVIAVAHAGRRGLLAGVVPAVVGAAVAAGAVLEQLTAVIGPGICGHCYEVPSEMREAVARRLPGSWSVTSSGTPGLNLPLAADLALRIAGVGQVLSIERCTMEDPGLYSYRREGRTGRFAGVVMLDA